MNDTTYDTIDAFIEAHEGLWFMIKDVTYKKYGKTLECCNRIKEIKCQSNYGKKNVM